MSADWICPFCKGTGKISHDIQPPSKLDTPNTIYEQGCTNCLGTGRIDLPELDNPDDFEDVFED
jgi:hypothetical protein